jgi:hypothetical protein
MSSTTTSSNKNNRATAYASIFFPIVVLGICALAALRFKPTLYYNTTRPTGIGSLGMGMIPGWLAVTSFVVFMLFAGVVSYYQWIALSGRQRKLFCTIFSLSLSLTLSLSHTHAKNRH